ncbi:glycerol-3-phosphate-acyltransferase [Russula earlei]|uniref:Glycerol-3-phosphate-acyltransferase n=1 Tax=Russula earlei TaxID=71964 RepID=A0ACC0U607_9AGAM|nr:glycerol-3-phosphate-acyltransferase [Russula earlei]
MDTDYISHKIIRRIASWAVYSFFTEVRVIGGENVPANGPIIVAATHHNMMLDPAILSSAFPHQRILHYWSKASLFVNPVLRKVLYSTGNIPVDRKSKDRQALFRGTVEALSHGNAVALFPEGTSYTEPRIMQVKEGAAWAALEYCKWVRENPQLAPQEPLVIVPCAIVYTNKSKYRSYVIMEFGSPIITTQYLDHTLEADESSRRAAVKLLTRTVETRLVELTINAPNWDTLYAARMARDLLWEDQESLDRDEYVNISQTLVDLFSTPEATPDFQAVRRSLLEYYSLLQSVQLTNSVLSSLPLPWTLDPHQPVALPSRLSTLLVLIRGSLAILIRLPFFILPLIVHFPAYVMGQLGARLAMDEEETLAQNKVIFAMFLLMLIYPAAFLVMWAFLWFTPIGAILSATLVWLFAAYHNKLINDNYEHMKRIAAAWRVLIGVWAPKTWEYSLTALAQYTAIHTPPTNEWVTGKNGTAIGGVTAEPPASPPQPYRARRPRSGRVMRHILRARAEAARLLASCIAQLEAGPPDKRVYASVHLARVYGGVEYPGGTSDTSGSVESPPAPIGWRSAREVVSYLRRHGAKIAALKQGIEVEWAAQNSDGDLSSAEDRDSASPRL